MFLLFVSLKAATWAAGSLSRRLRVMAAWNVMKEDYRYLILQSFVKTGWFPLAHDGSTDNLVKIKDLPEYKFR